MTGQSLWADQSGPPIPRPTLDGDTDVDVAIVGAGYTGLWTAHSLLVADPSLRVLVIERDHVGFGASGRNGGWCVGEFAAGYERLAAVGGHDAAVRQMRHAHAAVDEVGRVTLEEGIDCGFTKGGTLRLARNEAQATRLRDEVDHMAHLGFDQDVVRWLDPDEAVDRIGATDVRGALRFAPTAAVQPLDLVRGLADAVERRGARIVESTTATSLGPRRVTTDAGRVRAEFVVRVVEGYTAELAGHHRSLLPLYSLMIATEPIDADRWTEIGCHRRETFSDDRHLVIYGQRTADDRFAFGGRGAPYQFGSKIRPSIESNSPIHDKVAATLVELFPALRGIDITHRWGGVLGVPRDWFPSVTVDRSTGTATAGGYVGEGVATSNLAGRTLADLILDRTSDLVDLPWVGHRSRQWEPEPFRWLGVNAGLGLSAWADRAERRRQRTTWQSAALDRLLG